MLEIYLFPKDCIIKSCKFILEKVFYYPMPNFSMGPRLQISHMYKKLKINVSNSHLFQYLWLIINKFRDVQLFLGTLSNSETLNHFDFIPYNISHCVVEPTPAGFFSALIPYSTRAAGGGILWNFSRIDRSSGFRSVLSFQTTTASFMLRWLL